MERGDEKEAGEKEEGRMNKRSRRGGGAQEKGGQGGRGTRRRRESDGVWGSHHQTPSCSEYFQQLPERAQPAQEARQPASSKSPRNARVRVSV